MAADRAQRARALDARDPRRAAQATQALFPHTLLRLLSRLFGQPDRAYHLNELKLVGGGAGATQRALDRLERGGLLEVFAPRGRNYYRANVDALIYPELVALLRKTTGLAAPLREALAPLEANIEAAYACAAQSSVQRAPPPMHLLIVTRAAPDLEQLDQAMEQAEAALGRRLEPLILAVGRPPGSFAEALLAQPGVWVIEKV